jgi:hypothetical protein
MGKKSREDNILELFYNMPSKHWHFKEIKKEVDIADNKISRWLKLFEKEKLIKRVKEKGKMPYYISCYEHPEYQNRKKLFALKWFHDSGFLNHLCSLKNTKAVIIFGSFSRWDWNKESDIDLFIMGEDADFDKYKYEEILKREIQLFSFKDSGEFRKRFGKLAEGIINGHLVTGYIDFIELKGETRKNIGKNV